MGSNELKRIYDEAVEEGIENALRELADRIPSQLTIHEFIKLIKETEMKELSKYFYCRY